jgi:hypothetical protein
MGIFASEIFLLDFHFKGRKRTCKVCLRFQRCHINFSGVIDTAETVAAVSMTVDFFGEYEAICETALGRESGPQLGSI